MILSSADILRKLGSDAIVRQCARLYVVEGKPGFGTDECVYIYVDKYPTVSDFEATWKVWILDGGSDFLELVLNTIASLLPNFQKNEGYYTITDFATSGTVVKSEAEIQLEQLKLDRKAIKKDFQGLSEVVEGQLKGVRDGIDGTDGKNGLQGPRGYRGKPGEPGRPGRDLNATETELFDLKDVEQSVLPLQKGQVLTWNGEEWTNLYIPTISSFVAGGGGGGGGTGDGELVITSDDTPTKRDDGTPLQDGDQWWSSSVGRMHVYYVDEDSSQWVQSSADGNSGGTDGPGGTGGVSEAPTDGSAYVRKDADWVDSFDFGIEAVASKSFAYDANGNLIGVVDAEVSKAMTYDAQGRLQTLVATKGSKVITKTFQYAPDGTLNQIIVS